MRHSGVHTFLWVLTIIGTIVGGAILVFGCMLANGAPQQAAVGALAVAFAVIPYCLARAARELNYPDEHVADHVERQTKLLASIANALEHGKET